MELTDVTKYHLREADQALRLIKVYRSPLMQQACAEYAERSLTLAAETATARVNHVMTLRAQAKWPCWSGRIVR